MTGDVGGSVILLVGVMLVRITLTDVYQRYVKVAMGPWLLVAGVLLAALGLAAVVQAVRRRAAVPAPDGGRLPEPEHDHRHPGGDHIGWLLLAPVLALLLVAPPALGSFGVSRTAAVQVVGGRAVFEPLRAGAGPREMTLLEVNQRAVDRGGASFGGVTLTLTGFVTADTDPGGFRIARYQIACCAADAVASIVHVAGVTGPPPARDRWTTVVGRYSGRAPDGLPVLVATSVRETTPPVDPYE